MDASNLVKEHILRCYQLVPEAYRQRFRRFRKTEHQTYVEFAHEKEALFDRWCSSREIDSREKIRALVLVEEFKNCLPDAVATYLNEHKVESLQEAAVLADKFVLTHRVFSEDGQRPRSQFIHTGVQSTSRSEQACFYCKRPGHLVAECPVLMEKQAAKGVGLITAELNSALPCPELSSTVKTGYDPFISDGFVLLPGDQHLTPIRILHDTGAAQSFILHGVLPLSRRTKTSENVLVRGFEMGFTVVPLHLIDLKSSVITGSVAVGVCQSLPISGISFILGNDLAGGNVWNRVGSKVLHRVVAVPGKPADHRCVEKNPKGIPSRAATCAVSKVNLNLNSPGKGESLSSV